MSKKMYPDIAPGQGVEIDWKNQDYLMACCDCHLVHRLSFEIKGDKLIMRVWRENKRTASLRQHRGVPVANHEPSDQTT
jgi:hypothetical protein